MNNLIEHIGELLAQLQSADYFEREKAVTELGGYETDEAMAGLVIAIEDPNPGIRELASELLSKIQNDTAPRLLVNFLEHDNIGVRNLAAEILVKIGRRAVPILIENIENDDYDVRKFIVDILGLIKDESAVDAICQTLWDENINVVCSAAEALGEIGIKSAVGPLIVVFEKIEDARPQALEAIGKIGDPSALDKLYEFIKTDDLIIQYAGIEAIGKIGHKSSVAVLSEYLNSSDESVAELALMGIINISNRVDGNIDCDLPLDKFTKFLFSGIKEKDREITEFTINRLKTWFGHSVIGHLIDVLETVDEDDQSKFIEILGKVGGTASSLIIDKFSTASTNTKRILLDIVKQFIDDKIAKSLLKYVDDEDAEIRQKLAHIIGFTYLPEAKPILKKMINDEIGHVRSAAYAALGWLCDDEEIDILLKGLDDPFKDVREAAAGAMIMVGTQKVVDRFRELLFIDDNEKQRISAMALGMIGESSVVEPLIEAINHQDEEIRRSAVYSLNRIGDIRAIESLYVALNDECASVRKAAVTALVNLDGANAIPEIRFLLEDEDIWVRYHTINAIGDFGQGRFSEFIIPYINDDHDIIKIASIKALSKLGCKEAISSINQLVDDANKDLAATAYQAIDTLEGEQ